MKAPLRSIVLILAAVLTALAVFKPWRKPEDPKAALAARASKAPLFEARDKPMTIMIKALEPSTGRPVNVNRVIRQSKNRYNQMKQAVLAYLRGPSDQAYQAVLPEGLELNEFYLAPSGLAVVDLEVQDPGAIGFYEETVFIKGLIEVLTHNFFEVKQVKVLVGGQDAPTLAGHYALGTSDAAAPVQASQAPAD